MLYDLGFTDIDEINVSNHTNFKQHDTYPPPFKGILEKLPSECIITPLPLPEYSSIPHAAAAKLEVPWDTGLHYQIEMSTNPFTPSFTTTIMVR